MNDKLVWKEESAKTVFECPVFSVEERLCLSPGQYRKAFTVIRALDWAIVVPVLETARGGEFVMVRQWRHGAGELSLEFPGGVCEKGENPLAAAARELREETGYSSRKIESLGVFNPNPAIMSNRVHFFLAENLSAPEKQKLDEDEYVEVVRVPREDALNGMGSPPYIHALMGTALALYRKRLLKQQ